MMQAFKKYLQQFPHYKPSAYEVALPYMSEINLQAGEYFLEQGKISKQIAFIESGLLRIYYYNDGKEITNCFCRENSISCSYKSLITQQKSDMSIQAVEETKLLVFSYDSLQKLFEKDLFWQQVGRVAAENEFIVSESYNRFLKDLTAQERYMQILENDNELLQRVPLKYLATYLQIAPETLSRIRNKITNLT